MGYYTNSNPNYKPRGGGNTIQNVTPPQGYYVGSASNMARLFIFIIFLFSIFFTSACFYYGRELGRLEQKITQSRIIPCLSGGPNEEVSRRFK